MSALPEVTALRGTIVMCRDDPFLTDPAKAFVVQADGIVLCRNGMIEAVGPAAGMMRSMPAGTPVTHYEGCLIAPGFIDTRVRYVQTGMIASYGTQLLDSLKRYAFPAEMAFRDPAHAAAIARVFCDELLRNGRTLSAVEAFYLATLGGARALALDDRIGTIAPGREADLVVLDPKATPLLTLRNGRSESVEDQLFSLMMLGDGRAVRATYVAGRPAHVREAQQ